LKVVDHALVQSGAISVIDPKEFLGLKIVRELDKGAASALDKVERERGRIGLPGARKDAARMQLTEVEQSVELAGTADAATVDSGHSHSEVPLRETDFLWLKPKRLASLRRPKGLLIHSLIAYVKL
jgi:hypothetical protein